MSIGTSHDPIEVFDPASLGVASRMRSLTLRWAIDSREGRFDLEIHVVPREQRCTARVIDAVGVAHRLDLPTPLPNISIVDDSEAKLTHIDIPDVLSASLEPAPSDELRALYARTPLAPQFFTGHTHVEVSSIVADLL